MRSTPREWFDARYGLPRVPLWRLTFLRRLFGAKVRLSIKPMQVENTARSMLSDNVRRTDLE